jgi:MFS family permease
MSRSSAPDPSDEVAAASLAGWLVFATAGLFVFYQLILQSLPSVIRDGLVVDFSLTDSGFGSLSASFYYPYMLLQIPAGLLVMRVGSRRVLMCGLVLCIVASFITAISQGIVYIAAARVLMGLGAAPTFVATMALVARWFPSRLFPILVALTETSGMLGAALGQEILGFIVESAGWRAGMSLCGWLGALILVLTWLLVRDQPRSHVPTAGTQALSAAAVMRLMLSPTLILAGLVGGMIYSAGLSFAMLWGVAFFERHLGVDLETASFIASFYSLGIIIGLLAFGFACGRLAGPIVLLGLGTFFTGLAMAVILFAPVSLIVSSLAMLVCGIASGSYALSFYLVKSQVTDRETGAAVAFANMLIIGVGGLVLQPLIAVIADAEGHAVTTPNALGILVWAQGLGLILLGPLIWSLRARRPADPMSA